MAIKIMAITKRTIGKNTTEFPHREFDEPTFQPASALL